MTPELWTLYLDLQTKMAYPDERHEFVLDEKAINDAVAFYQWLVGTTGLSSPSTLLIGPGGINEVEAMRRAGAAPFRVLTAHAPEAGAIHRQHVGVETIVGDMHDMPIAAASLDLLYASNVMEHALSPYIALMECRRTIRIGGRAYFILPSFRGVEGGKGPFHLHCLTREVWEELLIKTGFSLVEAKVYPGGADLERLGITVNELLARSQSEQREFIDRTGIAYYMCFLCGVTTPPTPHDMVLRRLISLKG